MIPDDLSGRTLSRYRILNKLGAGGMGVVYVARDTQLDRTVALKTLPADVSTDQERMRRFVREAKAVSATDHPNIIHIYEIGEENGIHYIAMQYVEGKDLRMKINGQPLLMKELLEIAVQIVDALSEAHSRRVVHRDLKPSNIMITPRGHVKLLDFGLARIEKPEGNDFDSQVTTESKTESGLILGTVAYMSPEQALGNRVDHRTDIFSLGVLLYEMATGRRPFAGKNHVETIDKIAHSNPESLLRFNYEAPQELERIIRKCLEKDPERRYQSAAEVLVDLKNLKRDLDSSPPSPQPTPAQPQPVESPSILKRTGYRLILAAALFLSALAAFLLIRKPFVESHSIQSLAVLPFKNVNLDAESEYLSDGITDSIIGNLSRLKQLRVMSRGTVFAYKNKEVDPREIGKDLRVDGVVTGKLLQQGDSLIVVVDLVDGRDGRQIWGGQYDRKTADLLTLQSDISKVISENLRLQITGQEEKLVARQYTENPEAYQFFLKGQYLLFTRGIKETERAIEFYQRAIQIDPGYALAYDGLSNAYAFLGISGALLGGLPPSLVMPRAKEAARKAMELEEGLSDPHVSLGHIHWNYDWDWKGAEGEYKRGLELNPYNPLAYARYSFFLIAQGRKEEAFQMLQKYNELYPIHSTASHLVTGLFNYWARDYDRAIAEFQKDIRAAPRAPSSHFRLGLCYMEKQEYEKALKAIEESVDLSHRAPVALVGLGICYARMGRKEQAEQVSSELLQRSHEIYLPAFYMACLYGGLGQKDEAFIWLEKGYEEHANSMALLKVYPLIDPLRSDPRFSEMLARLNLQ